MKVALILAGGLGTRLRSVVPDLPKPMAPVAGHPFLSLLLHGLASKGIRRAVIAAGYKAELLQQGLGTRHAGVDLDFEIEAQPLGTGGAIAMGLRRCPPGPVVVLNGDTYLDVDINALDTLWHRRRQPIIVVREVPDVARYGAVRLEGDRVIAFAEKSGSGEVGLINAGCYVLPTNLLDGEPMPPAFSFERDYLVGAVASGIFRAHVTRGQFIDIGVPEDYRRAQDELRHLCPAQGPLP